MVRRGKRGQTGQNDDSGADGDSFHHRISTALNSCQVSLSQQTKALSVLNDLFEEDASMLYDVLTTHLKRVLLVAKKEPAVERLIETISKFATQHSISSRPLSPDEDEDETFFPTKLLADLLAYTNAKEKSVRARSCQIIAALMNNMDDECEVTDELADGIVKGMIERCRDKVPSVRVHAVDTLRRLQNPFGGDGEDEDDEEEACPVTSEYCRLLTSDSSKDVRSRVVERIVLAPQTIEIFLLRARDVAPTVRRDTFQRVRNDLQPTHVTIAQRVSLCKSGVTDREATVKSACMAMIAKWISDAGDIISFVNLLDPTSFEEALGVILSEVVTEDSMMKCFSVRSLFDSEHLSPEGVMVWYHRANHLKSMETRTDAQEEELDQLLPLPSLLAEALTHHEKMPFVTRYLLKLCLLSDLEDEVGRKALADTVKDLIINHSDNAAAANEDEDEDACDDDDILPSLVKVLCHIYPFGPSGESEVYQLVSDIVTELQEPIHSQSSEAVAEGEGESDETDETAVADAWISSLTVAKELVLHAPARSINNAVMMGLKDMFAVAIRQPYPLIRLLSVECIGAWCTLSQKYASEFSLLFVNALINDEMEIQLAAMCIIFDLLLVYEPATVFQNPAIVACCNKIVGKDATTKRRASVPSDSEDTEDEEELEEEAMLTEGLQDPSNLVIATLATFLSHEDQQMRTWAAEGFAKLFFANRLRDAHAFSRLSIVYFNPITEDDKRLRQCLSVFFPAFGVASPSNITVMEQAMLPTLTVVTRAPRSSPLSKINANNMSTFLLYQITSAAETAEKEGTATPAASDGSKLSVDATHSRIAMSCALALLGDEGVTGRKPSARGSGQHPVAFTKCVTQLLSKLSFRDPETIKTMMVLLPKLRGVIRDRTASSALSKVIQRVEMVDEEICGGFELDAQKVEELKLLMTKSEMFSDEDEDEDEDEDIAPQKGTKTTTTKKPAAATIGRARRKAAPTALKDTHESAESSDSFSEPSSSSEEEEEEEEEVVEAAKATRAGRKPQGVVVVESSDEEEESVSDYFSSSEEENVSKKGAAGKASGKRVVSTVSSRDRRALQEIDNMLSDEE